VLDAAVRCATSGNRCCLFPRESWGYHWPQSSLFLVARILYCGDVGAQTGFGRVAEYIIPALAAAGHEVHALCANWHGDPNDMQQHARMYPASAYGSDPFGSHRIAELVATTTPDLVFIVNDIWVAITLYDKIEPLKEKLGFKACVYTPIDSYGLFPELLPALNKWDKLITYTEFARLEIEKMGYEKPVSVVGHGTDFSKFFPLDREQCRKDLGIAQDAFIVFNGNRNQPRKRIDLTIKAFVKFAKDKPDARLWLHMGQKDMGWEVVPLMKRVARDEGYDATGKLILTSPHFSTYNCLPVEQLNKVYNAADVGVNTCLGEGWGLVNTEHASTGVAQIVPDHTSLKEIFDGVPRIAIESWETDRNYGLERGQPSPSHLAELLSNYYKDRESLKNDGKWCYDRMHQAKFSWDAVQKQMVQIVERLLEKPEPVSFKGFGTPVKVA
jgi:D-inositol-3-phosphate glycosyltransferase